MAAFASPGFGISTKAKPLDAPVALSRTRLQDWTVPNSVNIASSSCSVVSRSKFRIINFITNPVENDSLKIDFGRFL